jgi:hypothetical protein
MWSRQDKVWLHYVKDIIATDVYSAVFLASYLRYTSMNKTHIAFLEVIDLQKYKVIKQKHKVRAAIKERANVPFVFVVCKN